MPCTCRGMPLLQKAHLPGAIADGSFTCPPASTVAFVCVASRMAENGALPVDTPSHLTPDRAGAIIIAVKVAILFFSLCLPAVADLAAGLQALKNADYATALKEFLPLAKQGNAVAQFNLALMYDEGHGVPRDYTEAARWYRKAAEQGDLTSQNNLGSLYVKGHGVPQDYVQAYMWFDVVSQGRGTGRADRSGQPRNDV